MTLVISWSCTTSDQLENHALEPGPNLQEAELENIFFEQEISESTVTLHLPRNRVQSRPSSALFFTPADAI